MNGLNKLSYLWADWNNRLEFGFRVIDKPLRLLQMGATGAILLRVFGVQVKTTLWISLVAMVVVFTLAWLLSLTKLQIKADEAASKRSGPWIKLWKELDEIKKRVG